METKLSHTDVLIAVMEAGYSYNVALDVACELCPEYGMVGETELVKYLRSLRRGR